MLRTTIVRVQLTAIIAPANSDETTDVITATADDYDTARQQLEEVLPVGWRMLSLRRW